MEVLGNYTRERGKSFDPVATRSLVQNMVDFEQILAYNLRYNNHSILQFGKSSCISACEIWKDQANFLLPYQLTCNDITTTFQIAFSTIPIKITLPTSHLNLVIYAKFSTDDDTRRQFSRSWNLMSIADLTTAYPFIDWNAYFKQVIKKKLSY